jgi:multiple sugar transport system permease protein
MTVLDTVSNRNGSTRRAVGKGRIAAIAFLLALLAFSVGPLIFGIVESFRTSGQSGVTFANWLSLFRSIPVFTGLKNSLILAGCSSLLIMAVSSCAGFAFAKLPYRGSKLILSVIIVTLMLPIISGIVPVFLDLAKVHQTGSYVSTVFVYSAFNMAFGVIFFTNYFNSVPSEFIENAITEGASYFTVFIRIMIPMAVPALLTIGVFDFMMVWNDLIVALLLLPQANHATIGVVLSTISGGRLFNPQVVIAGALVSIIPNAVLLIVCNRYLVLGFSLGVDK